MFGKFWFKLYWNDNKYKFEKKMLSKYKINIYKFINLPKYGWYEHRLKNTK
jgi:hypothetical protein